MTNFIKFILFLASVLFFLFNIVILNFFYSSFTFFELSVIGAWLIILCFFIFLLFMYNNNLLYNLYNKSVDGQPIENFRIMVRVTDINSKEEIIFFILILSFDEIYVFVENQLFTLAEIVGKKRFYEYKKLLKVILSGTYTEKFFSINYFELLPEAIRSDIAVFLDSFCPLYLYNSDEEWTKTRYKYKVLKLHINSRRTKVHQTIPKTFWDNRLV